MVSRGPFPFLEQSARQVLFFRPKGLSRPFAFGKEDAMDLLLIVLLVLAVLSLGGWGYGYYSGPGPGPGALGPPGPAPWVSPIGLIGALLLIAFLVFLFTGWRPAF
jgi:hypothetical protein